MSRKVVFIGPLPPPIGGDTVSFERFIKNEKINKLDLKKAIIDISPKGKIKGERMISFSDISRGFSVLFNYYKYLRGAKLIFLWANRSFLIKIGLLIILSSWIFQKPIIVKFFGGSFDKYLSSKNIFLLFLIKKILGKSKYLLCQTKSLCNGMKKLGFPSEKIVFFPNYIPESNIKNLPVQNSKIEKGKLKCIFVGHIKKEKGVFDIIRALSKIEEGVSCDFFGPILDRDQEGFKKEIEKQKNKLNYKGVIEPQNVCKKMIDYDVLLLPSYHKGEGYPAVVIEAFNVGKPVIVGDWNYIRELVEEKVEGFIVPVKKPEALKEKIEILRDDDDLFEEMSKNSLKRAKTFSEETVIGEKLIKIMRSFI